MRSFLLICILALGCYAKKKENKPHVVTKHLTSKQQLVEFARSHTVIAPHKKRMLSLQFFDPRYKLRYCQIQKNMSTMMTIMLCDLHSRRRNGNRRDPRCYRHASEILSEHVENTRKPVWERLKPRKQNPWNIKKKRNQKLKKKMTSFVIVRDPIERFVSAFGHLCRLGNYCGKSGATVHTMAPAIYRFYQQGKHLPGVNREKMKQIDVHFAPQNWYCHIGDPQAKNKVKLLRYSEDQKSNIAMVDNLFKTAGMDQKTRNLTLQRMRQEKTWHIGKPSKKRQWVNEIYSNRTTMDWIMRTYYWDYVQLDFPYPKTK